MTHTKNVSGAADTAAGASRHSSARQAGRKPQRQIAFAAINAAALVRLPSLLKCWLPDGKLSFGDYVALNPKRIDRHVGSFRISVASGRWIDFATQDKGGDSVSLFAYLNGIGQVQAGLDLARLLGVDPYQIEVRQWRR